MRFFVLGTEMPGELSSSDQFDFCNLTKPPDETCFLDAWLTPDSGCANDVDA